MASTQVVREDIEAIYTRYAAALPEKVTEIEAVWARLQGGAWNTGDLDLAHRLVHDLTGSGAAFGFPIVSEKAATLERYLKSLSDDGVPPTGLQRTIVDALLNTLKRASEEGPSIITLPDSPGRDEQVTREVLFLAGSDLTDLDEIVRQLENFGFNVTLVGHPERIREALEAKAPGIVLADSTFYRQHPSISYILAEYRNGRERDVVVAALGHEEDIYARLEAVRVGASAYFTRPLDATTLVTTLDTLSVHHHEAPFRVLVVDDDPSLAMHYVYTLQQAGMLAEMVTDPLDLLDALYGFNPEAILMDTYLAECHGTELAAVIRQHEAFGRVPVTYLATDATPLAVRRRPEESFDARLVKPVDPELLVATLASQAQRSRATGELLARDSLTGTLTYTRLCEQLEIRLGLAQRRDCPVSFILFNIDALHEINQRYGYNSGDRVIKTLGHLLGTRLRGTDVIGRYEGGELAAILLDATYQDALRIAEEVRQRFRQVSFSTVDSEFTASVSAGVASFPETGSAIELQRAARQALEIDRQR